MKLVATLVLVFCLIFIFMLLILFMGPALDWFVRP